jgi:electron transfer flavoprotein beta subunit
MHIVVLVKQIPDPEAAFSMLKVDEESRRMLAPPGMPLVMSPFDEQALEAALRVRDELGQARITAVSAGPDSARNVLKHALAMGADDALLLREDTLENAGPEVTAYVLSKAVKSLGEPDMVLAGRQAADWDAGIVGCAVGELLGLPVITFACKVKAGARTLIVTRVLDDGFETLEADLPALVTVSNELGEARKPSLRETMRAARKPLVVKSAADLGLDLREIDRLSARRARRRLFVPERGNRCELVSGETAAEQAALLARRLREAGLL